MSDPEEQVDRLLGQSAERWRASLTEPEALDIAGLVRRRGTRRSTWPTANAAVLAIVLITVVSMLALLAAGPLGSHPASNVPTVPAVSPSTAGSALAIETAPPPSAPIRTVDVSGGGSTPLVCAGVGLTGATLQGDVSDPRVAWLDVRGYGTRGVLFPKGFTARFTPNLEILDWSGQVRFRAGDAIDGGCVWGNGALGDLLIGWPAPTPTGSAVLSPSVPSSTSSQPSLTPAADLLATLPTSAAGIQFDGIQIVDDTFQSGHPVDDVLTSLGKHRADGTSVFRVSAADATTIGAMTVFDVDGATLLGACAQEWDAQAVTSRMQRTVRGMPAWELQTRTGRITVFYQEGSVVYTVSSTSTDRVEAVLGQMR